MGSRPTRNSDEGVPLGRRVATVASLPAAPLMLPAVAGAKLIRLPWQVPAAGAAVALGVSYLRNGGPVALNGQGAIQTLTGLGTNYGQSFLVAGAAGLKGLDAFMLASGSGFAVPAEVWTALQMMTPLPSAPIQEWNTWLASWWGLANPLAIPVALGWYAFWRHDVPKNKLNRQTQQERRSAATWNVSILTKIKAAGKNKHPKGKTLIGYEHRSAAKFSLPIEELRRHFLVVGTTGSGKTTLLRRIFDATVESEYSLVVLDFKADPDIRDAFERYPGAFIWTIEGNLKFDVLAGDFNEFADKMVSAEGWSQNATFYQSVSQGYAMLIGRLMDAEARLELQDAEKGGRTPDIRKLHRDPKDVFALLDIEEFNRRMLAIAKRLKLEVVDDDDPATPNPAVLPGVPRELIERVMEGFAQGHGNTAIRGLQMRFLNIVAGIGEGSMGVGERNLDLYEAIKAGKPVLFSVDANRYEQTSKKIAAWVFLEVKRVIGRLLDERWAKTTGKRGLLVIDEFNALGATAARVVDLFERARGAGFGLGLGTTGLNAFNRIPDSGGQAIDQNTNTKIVMQQPGTEDQTAWVKSFGFITEEQLPRRINADGSVTQDEGIVRTVRTEVITKDELAALSVGQAIIARKGELHRVVVAYPRSLIPGWGKFFVR